MKVKPSSKSLISTGTLPCRTDQWFFIFSMMTLTILISKPISASESMTCLRALLRKAGDFHTCRSNKHNLSLSCLGYRIDFIFPQEQVSGGQLQETQAFSELHEMLQQSFSLFHPERSSAAWGHHPPGAAPHWTPSADGRPGRGRGGWRERKTLPWERRAPCWPWRGTSRASMSTCKRRTTLTAPGKSSE